MRPTGLPIVALLLLAGLAGCLGNGSTDDGARDDGAGTATAGLSQGTWPDGQSARDLIASYIMTHPFRVEQDGFMPYMASARDDLEAILLEHGSDVRRHEYDGGTNILRIQNGTTHPEQWVVLSAHYDTIGVRPGGIGPTVYGAWDDGAGTALLMELSRAFADWEFPFTIVYAFFDGEEKGLVGSGHFVDTYFEDGQHDLVANLNTDPPGLNWPCGDVAGPFAVKVIHNQEKVDEGMVRYVWLQQAVATALNSSGVPEGVVDFTAGIPVATAAGQGVRGGSDHLNFDAVHVANVYLGGVPSTIVNGDPNESTAAALTYPLHTPLDTLEAMEARCTEGSLAGGLQTIADVFAHSLTEMAVAGVPA